MIRISLQIIEVLYLKQTIISPLNIHVSCNCNLEFLLPDGRLQFDTFLEVMYAHSQREKVQQEVMGAFKAHDQSGRGQVNGADLYHVLTRFGEKLDKQEGMYV